MQLLLQRFKKRNFNLVFNSNMKFVTDKLNNLINRLIMKKILSLFFILAFFYGTAQEKTTITKIDIKTLKNVVIGKDVQFIDVRTPEEYAKGAIDDAVNIDIRDIKNFKIQVAKLNTKKTIYLYCHSGARSNKASQVLKELGFEKIIDFSGGWKAWSSQ